MNLGFRLPPSAGSASGVLPNPVGYNRIYVQMDQPFTVENWYDAYRDGDSFVTNGPMLFVETTQSPDGRLRLLIDARSRDALGRVEIVANGRVVQEFAVSGDRTTFQHEATVEAGQRTWVAVRCFAKADGTIRMAHTKPVFVRGGTWDATADAEFFVQWIDDLIAQTVAEPERFAADSERAAVLAVYREARRFFSRKTD